MDNERTNRVHDLQLAVSRYEDVLRAQFPLHLGDRIARALHELYATNSAHDVFSHVAVLCPKEVESARTLANSGVEPSAQRTLPNPDTVPSSAPSLFDAVASGDGSGIVRALEKMGVLALCPPPNQTSARLEFCVGSVLGRARLIVVIEFAQSLRDGLYSGEPKLVLEIGPFTGIEDSEIEDLIPPDLIARELDRWQRGSDVPFADAMKPATPIVPQIEAWAARHKVELAKPGWKVELAKRVKQRLLTEGPQSLLPELLDRWEKLFSAFQTVRSAVAEHRERSQQSDSSRI